MIKTPSPSNRYLYKKFRNRVVSEQRREKIRYFQNNFETHKTNIKMLWTGIKSIVNTKSKNQFSPISHLLDNGKRINDPVKMANIFNHYFVNVGSCIDKSIPRSKKSPMDYLKSSNPNSMLLAPVKEQEIEIIIQFINPKKAVHPYSIPTFLLKILSKYIAKPLSQIVNLSFEFGILPDNLNIGKVNPFYKKDSAEKTNKL